MSDKVPVGYAPVNPGPSPIAFLKATRDATATGDPTASVNAAANGTGELPPNE
jgi:hypothetical protein